MDEVSLVILFAAVTFLQCVSEVLTASVTLHSGFLDGGGGAGGGMYVLLFLMSSLSSRKRRISRFFFI